MYIPPLKQWEPLRWHHDPNNHKTWLCEKTNLDTDLKKNETENLEHCIQNALRGKKLNMLAEIKLTHADWKIQKLNVSALNLKSHWEVSDSTHVRLLNVMIHENQKNKKISLPDLKLNYLSHDAPAGPHLVQNAMDPGTVLGARWVAGHHLLHLLPVPLDPVINAQNMRQADVINCTWMILDQRRRRFDE